MDYYNEEYLIHYGVKGMKWGVRRYQKKDGSLTRLGKKQRARALDSINDDTDTSKRLMSSYKSELPNMKKINEWTAVSDRDTWNAKMYISHYKNYKTSDMLKKAYEDGSMKVGQDYITDKSGKITFTESGIQKRKNIEDLADAITKKNNKEIIEKLINKPERERQAIRNSIDKGIEVAQKIREDIKSKKYNSDAERDAAIDKAFRDAMEKADKSGDWVMGDELQQQWGFIYDDIEVGRY